MTSSNTISKLQLSGKFAVKEAVKCPLKCRCEARRNLSEGRSCLKNSILFINITEFLQNEKQNTANAKHNMPGNRLEF